MHKQLQKLASYGDILLDNVYKFATEVSLIEKPSAHEHYGIFDDNTKIEQDHENHIKTTETASRKVCLPSYRRAKNGAIRVMKNNKKP